MINQKYLIMLLLIAGFIYSWGGARAEDGPSRAGLRVWLDASQADTLERDGAGRLVKWRDRSGQGNDALNLNPKSNPATVAETGGKAMLRFNGIADALSIHGPLRASRGPVTVFAVSRRSAAQAATIEIPVARAKAKRPGLVWQRLLGSSDGSNTPDNKAPNFSLIGPPSGDGKAYPLTIDDQEYAGVILGTLAIGCKGRGAGSFFTGDIAEILVYDRMFLSEGDIAVVRDYLKNKWGARLAQEERGWTRIGPLENPPRRVSEDTPLSDQKNIGRWVKVAAFSDEFEGTRLDPAKWIDHFPRWKGRPPARFSPYNVSVSRGQLHLVMRKETIPKDLEAPGYAGYTSAAVQSRTQAEYGYYEVMARPMNSGGSSSFWFDSTDRRNQTEIDVFEIGGNAAGFERKYNMNLHVFSTEKERRHWNTGGVWLAPWRLADDFHVYGLDWEEKEITYYVDGVAVRRVKNTNWHFPLYLDFDSETMPDWFGMPKDEDLPSTFSIEYIRAWKHGDGK